MTNLLKRVGYSRGGAARFLALLFVLSAIAAGQTTHAVTLTWEDTLNPAGTVYAIYRGDGRCTQSPAMVKIAQDISVRTYTQNGVAVGNYCYHATAILNAIESLPSNAALAEVRPWSPSKLEAQIK